MRLIIRLVATNSFLPRPPPFQGAHFLKCEVEDALDSPFHTWYHIIQSCKWRQIP